MDKTALEALVRQVLLERLGGGTHGVKAVQVPRIAVTEEHRMDTGNPLTGSTPVTYSPYRSPRGWGWASWR